MNKLLLKYLIFLSISCTAQKQKNNFFVTWADEINKNFSYDSLISLSCINTPPGIYAIKFKIDKKGVLISLYFSNDTLVYLNKLFFEALKKSNLSMSKNGIGKGVYLQLIYFNNLLSCSPYRDKDNVLMTLKPDTSINFSPNYSNEINKFLNSQLVSINKSLVDIQNSNFQNERIYFLPPAFITDTNPNKKSSLQTKNDIKSSSISIEEMEKMIQDAKTKKIKQ
jgi:hypothetical protein